jgi:uncharacterized protein
MPTNVTPEYRGAEQRYRAATDPDEQLAALQEMLSTVPKHKGTEKLQADIKRRIAQLRKDALQPRKGGHRPFFHVERAEGGQTVLVGPPNAGKSLLLSRLTSARPEVADYAFTTHAPLPGMMAFEDTQVQLVDLPPVAPEGTEYWVFEIVKHADLVLLVVDVGDDDVLTRADGAIQVLADHHVDLVPADEEDRGLARPAIVVATKGDLPGARDNGVFLRELLGDGFAVVPVSAATGQGIEDLRRTIFAALRLIRVYTKAPGQAPRRTRPFLMPQGSTVLDAAQTVHHDFAQRLRFARIWGTARFDGQPVGRDDELHDGDLVEFHI